MRKNGPLLSRVVDPPGTKGGPRAGNFPGPPKNTFCPGWSYGPGQKALLSRVKPPPGTKDPFVPGRGSARDKRPPYISSPRPLFQHLATSAPSILLAAVVPSSAPPRPRAPRAPPRDPASPRQDPET